MEIKYHGRSRHGSNKGSIGSNRFSLPIMLKYFNKTDTSSMTPHKKKMGGGGGGFARPFYQNVCWGGGGGRGGGKMYVYERKYVFLLRFVSFAKKNKHYCNFTLGGTHHWVQPQGVVPQNDLSYLRLILRLPALIFTSVPPTVEVTVDFLPIVRFFYLSLR